ncbi:MAG TPA: TadE/TadG family type IV pilus assembly protein [Candidatus Dormibacteraeota bacterium]|nr:TadE/TadG family type IV pilus assembly protein [Candidatus Dormibacteraeota bacterium]
MRPRPRGQALVELALLLPVVLCVLCATVEFGFIAIDQMSLDAAARDGAQAGAVSGLTSAQAEAAGAAAASEAAAGLISCGLGTPSAVYASTVSPNTLTVTASCTYSPVTPLGPLVSGLLGGSLNTALTLTGSAVWRVQT